MKTSKYLTLLLVTIPPMLTGFAQTLAPAATTAVVNKPIALSAPAVEVEKLAQSGVGDEVMLAFINQCQSTFNLLADGITALKNVGVSTQVLTAMLNHDNAMRAQSQPASAPVEPPIPAPSPQTNDGSATSSVSSTAAVPMSGQPPVPPPPGETIPLSPGPDYVWIPGYWSWNGGVWIWVGGYWHYPARAGHIWVGGYWAGHGHGRYWVGGHWR